MKPNKIMSNLLGILKCLSLKSTTNQFLVLNWKNLLLIRRRPIGTILEILLALFFVFLILIIRNYVEIVYFPPLKNPGYNVIDFFFKTASQDLVLFYPNTPVIRNIVSRAFRIIKSQKYWLNLSIQGTNDSEPANLDYYSANRLLAFIMFPQDYGSHIPDNVVYTITTKEQNDYIYNVGEIFYPKKYFKFTKSPVQYCHDNKYFRMYNSFNSIKYALDLSIIQEITSTPMNDPKKVKIQPIGCLEYFNDELKASFGFLIPLIIQISFMFTLVKNLGQIVREKQTKMFEYLKIIGVKSYIYWFNCFLRSFLIYFILSILLSIVCFIELKAKRDDPRLVKKVVFKHTNSNLIFVSLLVYSIQSSIFTLFISQFFSKPFIAKLIAIIIWLLSGINFYNDIENKWLKYLFCLLPNTSLTFMFQIFFQHERSEIKLSFTNIFTSLYNDSFSLGLLLVFMILWSVILVPVTWYIGKIMPAQFGIPMPFYFVFKPSYWMNIFKYKQMVEVNKSTNFSSLNFEPEPELKPTVSLQNLTKKFRNGFKKTTAVNNMNINFYENEIVSLLGHNGAGKTTTIFMLCGIYPSNSGKATVLNQDLSTQLKTIRKSIGFCPQVSILYDDLTVYEHLYLVAKIKGFSKKDIEDEIKKTVNLLNLDQHLNIQSKNLSGGLRRRLNIGLALIGDPKSFVKIIILDEPSSGVDPKNRRKLWNILQKFKLNRTIIISTHYMQEADYLSDRIAIMNKGELKCCGSPKFLKKNFSQGYRLSIKKSNDFNEIIFKNIIEIFDEFYEIEENNLNELSVYLRTKSIKNIREFLENIEDNKVYIGFDSFSISSPTIEEVFLKMGKLKDSSSVNGFNVSFKKQMFLENQDIAQVFNDKVDKTTGKSLIVQQFKALFIKRFRIFIRRYFLALTIIILPLLIQIFSALIVPTKTNLVNKYDNSLRYAGRINLNIQNYGKFRMVYHIANSSYSDIPLRSMIKKFYKTQNRPNVDLLEIKQDNVSSFILNEQKSNLKYQTDDFYMAMSLNITNSEKFQAILYYSTLAFHSSAVMLNEISNLILTFITNDVSKSITTINAPLLSNNSLYNGNDLIEFLACLDILPVSILNSVIALISTFLISITVINVSRERISGSKTLQLLSGTNLSTYWISNYSFDLILFVLSYTIVVVCLKVIDVIRNDPLNESYVLVSDLNIFNLFILLVISSLSSCTMSYIWSFFFKSEIIGFIIVFIILGLGIFLDMVCSFLQLFISMDPYDKNKSIFNFLGSIKSLFLFILPNVTVKRGLYNMKIRNNSYCINFSNRVLNSNFNLNESSIGFNQPGIGSMILIFFLQFLIGNLIVYFLEIQNRVNFRKILRTKKQEIYENDGSEKNTLLIDGLCKKFGIRSKKNVLKDLHLSIKKSECFGILGVNGAGKTTLLKIIVGELKPSKGSLIINGVKVNKKIRDIPSNIGYCPQYSFLPEYLKVYECFELFADLKGFDVKFKNFVQNDLVRIFQLDTFNNIQVKKLSEGNKRKLSTALAFLGNPKLVILDEPTTGMDPASRIYFWNLIKKSQNYGITTIISSHSLEECEKLCSTLSILRDGKLECSGSYNEIKNKYGQGFSLSVKCEHQLMPTNDTDVLEKFLLQKIPGSVIKEKHTESLLIQIPRLSNNAKQSISSIFSLVEKYKSKYKIESFSISETTLEQIFMSFTESNQSNDE
nr:ATP-binding cassette subfamily A3-like 3 [Brachionus rubens]